MGPSSDRSPVRDERALEVLATDERVCAAGFTRTEALEVLKAAGIPVADADDLLGYLENEGYLRATGERLRVVER